MDIIQENTIKEMYSKRRAISKIVQATGISKKKIEEWLKQNNLWTGHRFLYSYFDEFFFDDINTEEKAYWLGFIYADGYISKNNEVGIELKSTDKDHLEKFRNSLKAERNIKIYHKNSTFGPQENCRFTIGSKHMSKILLGYYGSINKTIEGHFPKIINKNLESHVVRGFFDGDGCLTGYKDDNHLFRPALGFIGTHATLEYIEQLSGFSWSWSQRVQTNIDNFQIECGRVNDCLNFLSYMYNNATIYLDRKYILYQKLLENRKRLQAKARV